MATESATAIGSQGCGSISNAPNSSLEKSSTSLTTSSRVPLASLISCACRASRSESSPESFRTPEKPMMAFSGVRSSWLMLARKSALAAAPASARSRASTSSRSSALRAVTSRECRTTSVSARRHRVARQAEAGFDPDQRAVLADHPIFAGAATTVVEHRRGDLAHGRAVVGVDVGRRDDGAHLLGRKAERQLHRGRDVAPDAVDAGAADHVDGVVGQHPILRLAVAQGGLGFLEAAAGGEGLPRAGDGEAHRQRHHAGHQPGAAASPAWDRWPG